MKIIWYKPHEAPNLYQARYFPVVFCRADDTVYLPVLDWVQEVEEAVDRLFRDDLITADEFGEILEQLRQHQQPGEPLRETTPFKVPIGAAVFADAPGLHPFGLRARPKTIFVQVREVRWLGAEGEEDGGGPLQRLGVWLWLVGDLAAEVVDIDCEQTYLADYRGKAIARLAERPEPYRGDDDAEEGEGLRGGVRETRFALTLVFEAPAPRHLTSATPPDLLHLKLLPLCVRREVARWEFPDGEPVYPLIKSAGESVVLVEGLRQGRLSAEAERRLMDERNALDVESPGPYFVEHPVLLVGARLPARPEPTEPRLPGWRSPVDLLQRCPLGVTLTTREGEELIPVSTTIQVQSSHAEELEASYHFPQLEALPPVASLEVEVLSLVEENA